MRLLLGKAVGGVCGSREDGQKHLICFYIDLTGISQTDSEEKIFSYEGKEIPKRDLELIRRILETGEYDE